MPDRSTRAATRSRRSDELPTPAFDTLKPKPYVTHQKMFDPFTRTAGTTTGRSHKLGPLTDGIIDVVVDQAARVTSPLSAVPIFSLGGAVARVPEEATAFPYRDASHDINIVASWLPEEAGDADRTSSGCTGSSGRWNPTAAASTSTSPATMPTIGSGDAYTDRQWAD